MIKVDISNIWGNVSLPDLLAIEKEVFDSHMALTDGTGEGSDFLGWLNLPAAEPTKEMIRIQAAADRIRENSDVFVVVGIGGSYLGPRAAIELMQGPNHNIGKGKGNPQIFFAGNSLSPRHWNELCHLLDGKDFSIAIISKSGTTTEPAIATRALRWMLERKYGTEGAKNRIYAITDPCKGALRQMATEEGWESFIIPANVGGRFSVLTAVGLLPMAVAGIDIKAVMKGAWEARKIYDIRSFENPVWLYAAVRNLMYRKGKVIELLESFEPGFKMMGAWWQQLFGESEGKDGKGIFPVTADFSADLHSLGQMIQQGERNIFETMVRIAPPAHIHTIAGDHKNLDGLNYMEGKTLDYVDEQAYLGTLSAHVDGGVPVVTMDIGELNDAKLGELFYFFELSCGISAYMLGVNPFNQPGVEFYKRNMFQLLGKPGYEANI
jgi:glucose-6-phosphate isomerase